MHNSTGVVALHMVERCQVLAGIAREQFIATEHFDFEMLQQVLVFEGAQAEMFLIIHAIRILREVAERQSHINQEQAFRLNFQLPLCIRARCRCTSTMVRFSPSSNFVKPAGGILPRRPGCRMVGPHKGSLAFQIMW